MFLNEIKTERDTISGAKLGMLIDVYQFVPLTIKRDRNKSNDIYMVVNSNQRDNFRTKEQILTQMRSANEKQHLSKIMTLIAIKIEEKFNSMSKAFRFFDENGD